MRFPFVLLLVLAAGCSGPAPLYTAQTPPPATVVDGQADEWPLALRPVPREAGLGIGLRRDVFASRPDGADALAVVVIASDERQARRIALGGLRLWIDPEGGRDRVLGLQFPAPEPLGDRLLRAGRGTRGGEPATDDLRRRFQASLGAVEVTQGEAPPRRLTLDQADGLEAAAAWGARGLVVEVRVPLAPSPALLPTAAGDVIGLGVEVIDLQQPPRRRAPAQGERPRTRRGEAPDTGNEPEPEAQPAVKVETVTRWLRVE